MSDEPETTKNLTRRQMIKRSAIIGTAAVWAPPVIQSVRLPAYGAPGSPRPCYIDGTMTGGARGYISGSSGAQFTMDILGALHCSPQDAAGDRIRVRWGVNEFLTTSMETINCIDNPNYIVGANANFNETYGTAFGTFNGIPGYHLTFVFIDGGEGSNGTDDRITIVIRDGNGNVVLNVLDQPSIHANVQTHHGLEATGEACTGIVP